MGTDRKPLVIRIPYPVWCGMNQANSVCGWLRYNESFEALPVLANPRQIKIKDLGKIDDPYDGIGSFDRAVVVKYWFTHGHYVTTKLKGRDDSLFGAGATWELSDLRIQWRESRRGPVISQDIRANERDLWERRFPFISRHPNIILKVFKLLADILKKLKKWYS